MDCPRCGFSGEEAALLRVPSYLKRLRNCNDAPSEMDARTLLQEASEAQTSLHRIDQEIARLTASLRSLYQKRERLQDIVLSYRAVLHPIRHVPHEVLGEIFLWCLNPSYATTRSRFIPDSLDPKNPPWVLAQVCRSWRTIAISDGRLWTSVGFTLRKPWNPSSGQVSQPLYMLSLQLQRCGSHLMRVRVRTFDSECKVDFSNHPLLVLLCANAHRWQRAELHLTKSAAATSLSLISGNVPSLESLSLVLLKGTETTIIPPFHNALRLKDVRVHGSSRPFILPRHLSVLQWGDSLPSQTVVQILEGSQDSLVKFHATLSPIRDQVLIPTLHLPRLRVLFIHHPDRSQHDGLLVQLFDALYLPQLKVLGFKEKETRSLDFLTRFLQRSSCQLEELYAMSLGGVHGNQVTALFTALPHLKTLKMRSKSMADIATITGALRIAPVSGTVPLPVLLPKLKEFGFRYSSEMYSVRMLIDMIKTRFASGAGADPHSSTGSLENLRRLCLLEDYGRLPRDEVDDLVALGLYHGLSVVTGDLWFEPPPFERYLM